MGIEKEKTDSYNKRAEMALSSFQFDLGKSLFIIDTGRTASEKSVVKIENGKYIGFGFLGTDCFSEENMHDCIQKRADNREVQRIIRSYLNRKSVEKIIMY